MTKEEIYDSQIVPIVSKALEIAKDNQMPFLVLFGLCPDQAVAKKWQPESENKMAIFRYQIALMMEEGEITPKQCLALLTNSLKK